MAFGLAEDPGLSPSTHLNGVEYPVWREQLAKIAADNDASVDVINLFKCLPQPRYESKEQVLRDLGEAARRFGMGNHPETDGVNRDRRDLGRKSGTGG